MAASYREIDYRIRPGKHAERLMMVEAFRRLQFGSLESYQYIGLGSVYFSDFRLFHRALGMTKMVSVEKAAHDRKRFEANIPYGCIEMSWGDTASELPKIDLGVRSIIWLDYDGRLSKSILGDIREVAGRAAGGTVLAVTVQSKYDRSTGDDGGDRSLAVIQESLGLDRIPIETTPQQLRGIGTGHLFRDVIIEEITRSISDRNAARHPGQHMKFRQFIHFGYEDGVRMMTVGVIFYDAGQEGLLGQCRFEDLSFYRDGSDTFEIVIPKLTPREIGFLESQMPRSFDTVDLAAIPPKDAKQYTNIYRYFPNTTFIE
ncbi:O-methyltransferase [Methylobacterium sp. Leaf100]|uniref:O-methyltransferase n=1 Tax=Methylobacterium sp. Leaf100 TaxID=1736252 RepID=UPI000A63E8AA|nr:O-methyltransferase [Methylobacterium sp. Leaf100]